jgi:hypothetical protein
MKSPQFQGCLDYVNKQINGLFDGHSNKILKHNEIDLFVGKEIQRHSRPNDLLIRRNQTTSMDLFDFNFEKIKKKAFLLKSSKI